MRVVVKHPGMAPEIREIGNDLDSMQAVIAHGDFSMIELVAGGPEGLDLWANEEGKYASKGGEYLAPNVEIFDGRDYVMGTVFIAASDDEGEAIGLDPHQTARAIAWLNEHAVTAVGAMRAELLAAQFR